MSFVVSAICSVPSSMLIVSCSLLVSIRTERPEDTSVLATVVLESIVAILLDVVRPEVCFTPVSFSISSILDTSERSV